MTVSPTRHACTYNIGLEGLDDFHVHFGTTAILEHKQPIHVEYIGPSGIVLRGLVARERLWLRGSSIEHFDKGISSGSLFNDLVAA